MPAPADRDGAGPAGPSARPVLDLLGLAARARGLVFGTEMVRKAVRSGEVARVILAGDTSGTQRKKLVPLLEARGIPHHITLSQQALGTATGRGPVSAIGIVHQGFARRAGELLAALPSQQD